MVTVNANGSTTRVMSNLNPNSSLHDRTTVLTSADKLTVTTTEDINGDGTVDHTFVQVENADGSVLMSSMDGTVQSAAGRLFGSVHGRYETSAADGLSRTIQYDTSGNGLSEKQTTDTVVLNADGTQVQTIINANLAGAILHRPTRLHRRPIRERRSSPRPPTASRRRANGTSTGSGSFTREPDRGAVAECDGSRTETVSTFVGAALRPSSR